MDGLATGLLILLLPVILTLPLRFGWKWWVGYQGGKTILSDSDILGGVGGGTGE